MRWASVVRAAVQHERARDLTIDPSLAVTELGNIAWTAISSAKHNPQTRREAINRLRDLLARWSHDDLRDGRKGGSGTPEVLPIVYADSVVDHLVDTLLGLLVVSAEAHQPDTYGYVIQPCRRRCPSSRRPRSTAPGTR